MARKKKQEADHSLKDFIEALDEINKAKGIDKEEIIVAVEQALVAVQISELAGQFTFEGEEATNGKDVTSKITEGLGTTGVAISSGTIKIKDDNTVAFNAVKATLDGKIFDVTYKNGRVTAAKPKA